MTAQHPHQVRFKGVEYDLAAIDGAGLFDPRDHGIEFVATTSANWAGYVPVYSVRRGWLRLAEIRDAGLEAFFNGARVEELPRLDGVLPTEGKYGGLSYRGLDIAVPFTGAMLIGRGFISALYTHMGFAPAWKYERVHELIVEGGRVLRTHDRSDELAAVRQEILAGQRSDPDAIDDLLGRIARQFERDYGRSLGW